jgi:hypothetical protein
MTSATVPALITPGNRALCEVPTEIELHDSIPEQAFAERWAHADGLAARV